MEFLPWVRRHQVILQVGCTEREVLYFKRSGQIVGGAYFMYLHTTQIELYVLGGCSRLVSWFSQDSRGINWLLREGINSLGTLCSQVPDCSHD